MPRFDGGVRYYTHYTAEVGFPEGDTVCNWCPMLHAEYGIKRVYCQATGEYIPEPEYMRGGSCPLLEKEEEDG